MSACSCFHSCLTDRLSHTRVSVAIGAVFIHLPFISTLTGLAILASLSHRLQILSDNQREVLHDKEMEPRECTADDPAACEGTCENYGKREAAASRDFDMNNLSLLVK